MCNCCTARSQNTQQLLLHSAHTRRITKSLARIGQATSLTFRAMLPENVQGLPMNVDFSARYTAPPSCQKECNSTSGTRLVCIGTEHLSSSAVTAERAVAALYPRIRPATHCTSTLRTRPKANHQAKHQRKGRSLQAPTSSMSRFLGNGGIVRADIMQACSFSRAGAAACGLRNASCQVFCENT